MPNKTYLNHSAWSYTIKIYLIFFFFLIDNHLFFFKLILYYKKLILKENFYFQKTIYGKFKSNI